MAVQRSVMTDITMTDEMNISAKKKRPKHVCCVVGCKNSRERNPDLHFYSFPGRSWEIEQKNRWIAAVRPTESYGKLWKPKKTTRICSAHFLGGERSHNPRNEAYCPTIFPTVHKKRVSESSRDRAKRFLARRNTFSSASTSQATAEIKSPIQNTEFVSTASCSTANAGVQTDFVPSEDSESRTILFCSLFSTVNEASTQTDIIINDHRDERKILPNIKQTNDASTGRDCNIRLGFAGFEDINSDAIMKQLGGITLSFYFILLNFIKPNKDGQPVHFKVLSAENRLFLFLMKMKLGIGFSTLGCMFRVSKTTASSVFFSVLNTLYINTRTWLSWPSREAINKMMPPAFKNYPNCRAIIDCTELGCDCPPSVEQRTAMYSPHRSGFAVKYLIAMSPSGLITFVSKGYGGHSTDGFIANDSGFINLVEPGDLILADKDFPQIRTELSERKCTLVMPPVGFDPQFTREEILERDSVASVRIHVERAIQRVKIFRILDHLNIEILPVVDKIMHVSCALANNKEPIIHSVSESEPSDD